MWDNLLGRRNRLRDVDREVAELSDRERFGDVWESAGQETDIDKSAAEGRQLAESVVYAPVILEAVRLPRVSRTSLPLGDETEVGRRLRGRAERLPAIPQTGAAFGRDRGPRDRLANESADRRQVRCDNRLLHAAPESRAELGYVPASKVGAELLFDIIATAYERQSLIVTTNLPFENWTEVLGSERLTGAALDRLTHRCHILETKGESYRLQDAQRRRRKNPQE